MHLLKEQLLQTMSLGRYSVSVAVGLLGLENLVHEKGLFGSVTWPCNRKSGEKQKRQNSLTRLSQLNVNNGVAWLLIIVQLCPNAFNITKKAFEKLFRHSANQVNRC